MLFWSLLACGTSGGRMHERARTVQEVGSLRVTLEAGSRVRETPEVVSVDSPDGRRWFDLTWRTGHNPRAMAEIWAARSCEPVFWDREVRGEGWLGLGGMCTIEDRRHWAIVLVRPTDKPGQQLMITYVADYAFVPYEDAWVDFVQTALTVGEGAPAETLPVDVIQRRVRAGVAREEGRAPIPGGGVISSGVHAEMVELYDRLAAPAR